jgi:hypothetical protein
MLADRFRFSAGGYDTFPRQQDREHLEGQGEGTRGHLQRLDWNLEIDARAVVINHGQVDEVDADFEGQNAIFFVGCVAVKTTPGSPLSSRHQIKPAVDIVE